MKRRLLNFKNFALALGVLSLGLSSQAQTQIGNAGFETWQSPGSSSARPDNWNNIMNGNMCGVCGFGQIQTTWREATTIHSGTYSVKIVTGSTWGQTVNGSLTLGQLNAPSTTPSAGFNMTVSADANFSEAFTDHPDSIVFWANYSVTGSGDSARISAVLHDAYDLHDPQDAGSASHVVATARKNFQTGGASWVRMSIPFDYSGPASTVNYIIVTFTSSYTAGSGTVGATLFVDDVSLIYNPNVTIAPTADQNLVVYQNGTALTATEVPTTAVSRQWKYGTATGGPYSTSISGETAATYTPMFTTAGTYYVVCESDFGGGVIKTSNEVKVVVTDFTNSIAPTTTQNLVENQAGTTLTVTETPTAASREWKYTTTSGSGYTSFGTAQTSSTYTPQFATAGTYYVVCQSTLYGNTITSNEVQVNVTVATSNSVSIAPNTTQNLATNQAGTQLTETETPAAANSREWKYTTTSGSGYASFAPSQTGSTYTPQFATAGTYYVVCVSDFGGGDIATSNEVTVIVTDTTTGIVENEMGKILIYSTANSLNVDLSGSSLENATLRILDLNGQTLNVSKLNKTITTVTTNLPTGIYFYAISTDKNLFQGKIYLK